MIYSLTLMLLISNYASAWIDLFGKNKERKLNFSNQLISEVLTEEEMTNKRRIKEKSWSDGDHIYVLDVLKGDYPNFTSLLVYELNELFREQDPDTFVKKTERASLISIDKSYKKINKMGDPNTFHFEVIQKTPNDLISISRLKTTDKESDLEIVSISRYSRIKKWSSYLSFFILGSELTEEKKNDIINRLKNSPSINNWISRQKGS